MRAEGTSTDGPWAFRRSRARIPPPWPTLGAVRTRLLPALLTALGVTLLAAGLLTYTTPVTAGPGPSRGDRPSAVRRRSPTDEPLITLPPLGSAPPSGRARAPPPTGSRRGSGSPPSASTCRSSRARRRLSVLQRRDVPRRPALGQPGQGKATYLYAHAREGMFLPLLRTSGKKQIGMVVEVWTSDDQRFLYEITEVRRDQRDLDDAANADHEQLWLQTSEGPAGTPARPRSSRSCCRSRGRGPRRRQPEAAHRPLQLTAARVAALDPVDLAQDQGRLERQRRP